MGGVSCGGRMPSLYLLARDRFYMVKQALQLSAVALALASVTGCQQLGIEFSNEPVQYESSTSRAPLEIPPDLSAIPRTDRYTVPTRPQIVSANAEAARLQAQAETNGTATKTVLPETKFATVERDGQTRWVHVNAPAEKVWPVLQDFWPSVGLAIKNQDAASGVIQTEWAENKANLPHDIIRKTLGKIFDTVYDTGERDQYRARMERNNDGTCNIYITHRSMVEVLTGNQQESTMWQPGASDPQLEAEMLTRLAQKLDAEFNPDAKPAEQKAVEAIAAVKYEPTSEIVKNAQGEAEAVIIKDPYDRAWRRVGVALDRGGFDVYDRDRSQGLFMIKYLDPDYETAEKGKQGFFTRMFSKGEAIEPVKYQVRLMPDGDNSRLTVTGEDGKADTTGVASRIITLLGEQLR